MYWNRGGGAGLELVWVLEIAQINISFCKFSFLPTMKSGSRGWGGGGPRRGTLPPPVVLGPSNTSLEGGDGASENTAHSEPGGPQAWTPL